MLTITRIHYSIDVIGALIFAPFWYLIVVKKHLTKFDFGFSVPYYIARKIYKKCKGSVYDPHGTEAELQSHTGNTKKV